MIALLRGVLVSSGEGQAVIDVGGVGYLIFASARTLDALGMAGSTVTVHVETHVREDHIHLYGFATQAEKSCFKFLQTVQGVGAKHALSILSVLSPDEVSTAIAAQDKTMLTRADGVGPKLATRIVNELKDKVAGLALAATSASASASGTSAAPIQAENKALADTVSALVNLGYGRSEAFTAVAAVQKQLGEDANLDALIPAALKELSA